mmetsp:Transcript_11091/g.36496  ORF Transcript_11091/g.36496 Transcript_11091/m.36496 type:complete len:272 (+) Transcript_11091:107-922(+)
MSALLAQEAARLEAELKSSFRKRADPRSVAALRNRLRDKYEELLTTDYALAQSNDVEPNLWKLIFYKRVEELRKKVRKLQSASTAGEPEAAALYARQLDALRQVLREASGFYHDLIRKLEGLKGPVKTTVSLHRCYIFLGDLARYTEWHKEGRNKDWSIAESYYMEAVQTLCTIGHPQNQLAVLATYMDDDLLATYRYFRCLAVEHPFSTARDNLVLAFEKARTSYEKLAAREQAASRVVGNGTGGGNDKAMMVMPTARRRAGSGSGSGSG